MEREMKKYKARMEAETPNRALTRDRRQAWEGVPEVLQGTSEAFYRGAGDSRRP